MRKQTQTILHLATEKCLASQLQIFHFQNFQRNFQKVNGFQIPRLSQYQRFAVVLYPDIQ